MKKLFISALLAVSLLTTGCITLTTTQLSKAQNLIRVTVPVATEFAALKDANVVPYLRACATTIDIVASTPNVSPQTLLTELDKVSAKEFHTPEAKLAIMAGLGIFQTYYAETVAGNTNFVAILQTLSQSIRAGLPPSTTGKKSSVKRL